MITMSNLVRARTLELPMAGRVLYRLRLLGHKLLFPFNKYINCDVMTGINHSAPDSVSDRSPEENADMIPAGKSDSCTHKFETQLYVDVKNTQWPIVYGPEYNIGFLGLERLHPFDAGKWEKVYSFLKEANMIRDDTTVRPLEATETDLLLVHTKDYLNSLKWSMNVASITEVPPVALLPNFIVQRKVLRPFRFQTGGTILAAKLAVDRGWGINIGGGFHHCSGDRGGGFCAYADITLAIKFLFHHNPKIKKAMIVDLDAHQGNGHERDFMDDESVYIMDVYNRGIYPHDGYAKRAIRKRVELSHGTEDTEYLKLVERNLTEALNEFQPDVIVYNAGTDILEGDPLGNLSITPDGIINRDELVFKKARELNIPIVMVTSGGYQRTTAKIIANSILNLKKKKLIQCEDAENCAAPATVAKVQKSPSDGGIFARLKSFCLSSSGSSAQSKPGSSACTKQATSVDKTLSKSSTDLVTEADIDDILREEVPASKSCSDLTYCFKDESDIDIASLLEARFGHIPHVKQDNTDDCV